MDVSQHQNTIEDIQQLFQHWRSSRKHREPIPQNLWEAAVSLCQIHSVYKVSKALKLSFNDLKKRCTASLKNQPVEPPQSVAPVFHSIDLGTLFPDNTSWQLVCERPDGSVMRFSANAMVPSVSDLIRGFFS